MAHACVTQGTGVPSVTTSAQAVPPHRAAATAHATSSLALARASLACVTASTSATPVINVILATTQLAATYLALCLAAMFATAEARASTVPATVAHHSAMRRSLSSCAAVLPVKVLTAHVWKALDVIWGTTALHAATRAQVPRFLLQAHRLSTQRAHATDCVQSTGHASAKLATTEPVARLRAPRLPWASAATAVYVEMLPAHATLDPSASHVKESVQVGYLHHAAVEGLATRTVACALVALATMAPHVQTCVRVVQRHRVASLAPANSQAHVSATTMQPADSSLGTHAAAVRRSTQVHRATSPACAHAVVLCHDAVNVCLAMWAITAPSLVLSTRRVCFAQAMGRA